MKKSKTDISLSHGSMIGGYPDLDHAAGDSCGLEAVTSLSCRIPATSEHAAPPPHVAVSGPAHYFYSSLEIFKDEHLNLYSTHTLPVN